MTRTERFFLSFVCFLVHLLFVKGQEKASSYISPRFKSLQNKIYYAKDADESYFWAKEYIKLAKAQGNDNDLLSAYENAALFSSDSLSIKYGDSILNLSVKIKDQISIGNTYYLMATRCYGVYDYKKASEFAIIAYDYFNSQKADNLARRSLFNIAKLKLLVGNDESARSMIRDQYLYFKDNQTDFENKLWYQIYLSTLISINAQLKRADENTKLLHESDNFFASHKDLASYQYLRYFSDATNDFYLGKYDSAILKISKAKLDDKQETKADHFDFYLAMSYWKSNQIEKAFPIFENIKKNYYKTKRTSLAFRPAFDFFTEYYKKHGTTEQQLASMNDLLEFDTYEKDVRKYVQGQLKEFDEKHNLEEENNSQKEQIFSDILSYVIIFLSSIALIYYVKKVKSNKKPEIKLSSVPELKVKEISAVEIKTVTIENFKSDEIDYSLYSPINKITVNQIIDAMKSFESSLSFLQQDIKLLSLAQKMNTNEKYLSKVIKIYKGKTFNSYLTDLRFEYLDEKLKTDSPFRNQKIKDISSKLGFGSPEFFATAFKEKYGRSPKEFFESN